jgi:myo-inositol-1(or 4)-monophosphatase
MIIQEISAAFPEDTILSEESGKNENRSDRVWIIDPIDGTTNFAHDFPFYAVSIGLQVREKPVLGMVYNPAMDEFFEASEGNGAFLNGKPLRVTETENINDALLATGFPYDIHEHYDTVLLHFKQMIIQAQGVRRPGSAALDLCYVASGRFDGFWEEKLHPWDTAAGMVVVREAGGRITTFDGGPYTPFDKTILATNARLHDIMIQILGNQ